MATLTTASMGSVLSVPFGPRDQDESNCCVAVSVVTAMEILDALRGDSLRLSPLFNYYVSRDSPQYTGDVTIRDGLDAATRYGVCRSELHEATAGPDGPFTRADALRAPSGEAQLDADSLRLKDYDPDWNRMGYYTLDGSGRVAEWLSALEQSSPIVMGFHTTNAYQQLSSSHTEVRDVSGDSGASGHAVVVYGYRAPWFLVRDSRGRGFADRGGWRLHKDVVDTPWVAESWAIACIGYDT